VGRVEKNPEFLGDLIDETEKLSDDADIIFSQSQKWSWKTGRPGFMDNARDALAALRAGHAAAEQPVVGSDTTAMIQLLLQHQERRAFVPIVNPLLPWAKPNLSDYHLKNAVIGSNDMKKDLLEGIDPQLAAELFCLLPSSSFPKGGRDRLFRVLHMATKTGGRVLLLPDNRTVDDELRICASINVGQRALVNVKVMNLLLELGAKPWASDLSKLRGELSGASWIVDMRGTLVAVVLREGSSIDSDGNTPLHKAVQRGDVRKVRELLAEVPLHPPRESYVDSMPDQCDIDTILHKVVVMGKGSQIASKGDTPLHWAAQGDGIIENLRILTEFCVKPLGKWDSSQLGTDGDFVVVKKCNMNAIFTKVLPGAHSRIGWKTEAPSSHLYSS
jgi:hypothetical protein